MKKLMASAVVLSMVLVGCGSGKDSKKPEIALVTDSGGLKISRSTSQLGKR